MAAIPANLFTLASSLVLIAARLIIPTAIVFLPAIAPIAMHRRFQGTMRSLGQGVGAAIINAPIFAIAAGVDILIIRALYSSNANLPDWFVVTLLWIVTVMIWAITAPYRKLNSMVSPNHHWFGAGVGSMSKAKAAVVGAGLGYVKGKMSARQIGRMVNGGKGKGKNGGRRSRGGTDSQETERESGTLADDLATDGDTGTGDSRRYDSLPDGSVDHGYDWEAARDAWDRGDDEGPLFTPRSGTSEGAPETERSEGGLAEDLPRDSSGTAPASTAGAGAAAGAAAGSAASRTPVDDSAPTGSVRVPGSRPESASSAPRPTSDADSGPVTPESSGSSSERPSGPPRTAPQSGRPSGRASSGYEQPDSTPQEPPHASGFEGDRPAPYIAPEIQGDDGDRVFVVYRADNGDYGQSSPSRGFHTADDEDGDR